MIKKLLIGFVVLIAIFFVGGMFFYAGKAPRQSQPTQATPQASLILPIKKEDALTKYQGIWPFGIRGGDHPNGHPGIDFEIKVGAPILAVASGKVSGVGEAPGGEGEQKITIDVETGQSRMTLWYVGPMKILVKEGGVVKTGDVIASAQASKQIGPPAGSPRGEADESRQGDVSFLHFETFKMMPFPPGAFCPAEVMSQEARKDLEQLHTKSKYKERDQFPLLCNACPAGFYPFGGCR